MVCTGEMELALRLLAELRTTDLAVWSEVHRLESPLWDEQQTMASLGLLLTTLCGGAATSLHSGAWALCIAMCSGTCVLCQLLAFAAAVRLELFASPVLTFAPDPATSRARCKGNREDRYVSEQGAGVAMGA